MTYRITEIPGQRYTDVSIGRDGSVGIVQQVEVNGRLVARDASLTAKEFDAMLKVWKEYIDSIRQSVAP